MQSSLLSFVGSALHFSHPPICSGWYVSAWVWALSSHCKYPDMWRSQSPSAYSSACPKVSHSLQSLQSSRNSFWSRRCEDCVGGLQRKLCGVARRSNRQMSGTTSLCSVASSTLPHPWASTRSTRPHASATRARLSPQNLSPYAQTFIKLVRPPLLRCYCCLYCYIWCLRIIAAAQMPC